MPSRSGSRCASSARRASGSRSRASPISFAAAIRGRPSTRHCKGGNLTETELKEEVSGIGAELARAREEQGLALADVAQQLKFAARQLEALEKERFDLLPGGTFARGMVRNYARLLKLD